MKNSHYLRGGAAVVGTALFLGVSLGAATQAAAPSYERALAGIRLNSTAKTVLAKYGNPNEVVIGDVSFRQSATGAPGAGGASGAPGMPGGEGGAAAPSDFSGGGGGLPAPAGGGMSASLPPSAMGKGAGGGMAGGFGGGMGGYPGSPGFPGSGGPMGGDSSSGMGGNGGQVGPFGNTESTVARQQEVTWIYNRKFPDKKGASQLVSYEFLVGPAGQVEQIRVSGYTGGNIRTNHGIGLGSTYRDVIRAYGYPEEHSAYGNVLVASYKNRAHVSFQFLNDRVSGNVINPGNKVIGITIATVE